MIHVVSYKFLSEYLNLLYAYYWFASSRMIKEQDLLLELVQEIVEYTQRRMHRHRDNCVGNFRKIIEYTNGKPFVGKLNAIRNPIVYFYRKRRSTKKCRYDVTKASVEDYCCVALKTSKENGVVEIDSDNNEQRFLINLVPESVSSGLINSGCSVVVERTGLNWCLSAESI